jgi:multisubunit Na+/H+ antiporter MnhC subunit
LKQKNKIKMGFETFVIIALSLITIGAWILFILLLSGTFDEDKPVVEIDENNQEFTETTDPVVNS